VARALLLTAVLAFAVPVAPAAALVVGLGDQQADSWSDGRLRALGLGRARLIVPWDAATSEPARVQAWLTAVAAAGAVPHVAFEHLRGERCPSSPCSAPSRSRFRAAVAAFHARFPQVTTFTTWNEANHRSQPVVDQPESVAGYYEDLRAVCPTCTIVAGDVLDSGGYVTWLERFQAAAPSAPRLWGLHNYGDVTYGRTTGTDRVLATVPGELWIEETGGIVTLRSGGRETLRTDEARASRAVDQAFAIAAARPRITRMYVYHWRGRANDSFDAGLIRPDNSARPSYTSLARHLGALARATTGATTTTTAGATAIPRPTVAWSRARPSQLVVRLRCRAPDGTCRGRVRIALALRARTGGRETTAVLSTRAYATRASARTVTLRVTVPRALRARARRAARRVVALRITPAQPRGATAQLRRTVDRPRR